jgi:hypothetical protein
MVASERDEDIPDNPKIKEKTRLPQTVSFLSTVKCNYKDKLLMRKVKNYNIFTKDDTQTAFNKNYKVKSIN